MTLETGKWILMKLGNTFRCKVPLVQVNPLIWYNVYM